MKDLKVYHVGVIDGDSAYLIDDGKTAILYDSGFAFTGYELAENIKKILGERALDYILLTHSHYDHVLGSIYVKRKYPHAKIVAGEYATKIFEKPSAKTLMRELDKSNAVAHGILEYEDLIDELSVDIAVKDNDILKIGDMTFEVVALPGHTKCSIGFYLRENKLLLGCETLGLYSGSGEVMPCYLVGYDMAINSIKRAINMDIKTVLVSHFGLLDENQTKLYLEKSLKNAVLVAKEIVAIFKNGGGNEDAFNYFSNKFYKDRLKDVYPIDAMTLNTNIMIELIKKEFLKKS